jgi:hypothetical protein
MFDYIAYLMAQQRTADRAREALPDSPVRSPENAGDPGRWSYPFRRSISNGLRWLADRLDPIRDCPAATTGCG